MTTARYSVAEGCLLGAREIYITDSLVTEQEQATLLEWAETQYRSGKLHENPRDPGAHCTPFRSEKGELTRFTKGDESRSGTSGQSDLVWVPEVRDEADTAPPGEFWRIRSRVVDLVGLSELEEDHYKGSFLSYIAPGAGIHRHLDARLKIGGEDRLILRCNVFLKRPHAGGLPIIESREFDIPDRGMWVFYPTELFHSATPVGGSAFRGLLSFGFLVRPDQLWHRRFRLAPDFERDYGLAAGLDARRTLLDQLRDAQAIPRTQLDLLEFVLLSAGSSSAQQVADAVGKSPAETLQALENLQRANILESHSSTSFRRGQVMVI
jgi:hypothetical protein